MCPWEKIDDRVKLNAAAVRATFAIFSTACFVGYWWSTRFVPETAGLSLESSGQVRNMFYCDRECSHKWCSNQIEAGID